MKPRGFPSGKIYIIDSEDTTVLSVNDNYEEVTRISNITWNNRCAVIDKKIYTTGGFYNSDVELRLPFRSTNEAHVYSFKDNNTTLMAPMNSRRFCHGCCSHAGHLFVCGGKDGEPSACCEKLIIKDNKWFFIAEMNEARWIFQVVTCGKYLWAIGGQGKIY